jgi:hypothetical protein
MKAKNGYRIGMMVFGLMLTLAACFNLTGPGQGVTVPEGMGLARIILGGGGARTVVPGIGGLYYTLDFTAPGKTAVNKVLGSGTSLTVALEPAVWTLTVNGYTDSTKAVHRVRGTASVSVTAGTESSFDVYLAADFSSGGTGNLSYSFVLPATVSRAWFGLYPLDVPEGSSGTITADTWEKDISSSANGTASDTLADLPEGVYLAVVDLYDGLNNEAAVWTRAVHIDDSLSTSLNHSFTAGDFAECDPVVTAGTNTLADKLDAALNSPSGAYTIVLNGTESDLGSFTPKNLIVMGNKDITVTIRGNGKEVQLSSTGNLFAVGSSYSGTIKLVLQDVTLRGLGSNNDSLVEVGYGGTLEMKAGSLITGNANSSSYGGGVEVMSGTFTMSGGAVSGNTASYGGGVRVGSYATATFTMSGGAVSGNSASSSGGGVDVTGGTFSMSGGAVSGNTVSSSISYSGGGGVLVNNGTFSMSGGAVSGNTSDGNGGVFVYAGTFTMNGGEISGNTSSFGGGVFVYAGTFTMNGGEISGNTSSFGGGVCVDVGTFIMNGGEISGNTSSDSGGGVCVDFGTFTMNGGEISGNTVSSSISYSGGGGVYVTGTFTMNGGEISGNTFSSSISYSGGGGVFVLVGTFTMNGGEISGNTFSTSTSTSTSTGGGGVYVDRSSSSGATFTMSGGTVSGNMLSGADGYGREVMSGTFKISGEARPERIFLDNSKFITIAGPLSGGVVPIDLRIYSGLTNWAGEQILQLDDSYSGGDLASLKTHFILGNSKMTESPYTEAAITGYTIDDGGYFVAE